MKQRINEKVYEKMLLWFKKFKILLRHYYMNYEKPMCKENYDKLRGIVEII